MTTGSIPLKTPRPMRSCGSRFARTLAVAAAVAATGCVTLAAAAPANAVARRTLFYNQIVNWHSGKCIDVDGASQAVGAKVQQFACNGTVAQQWTKQFTDSGYFMLRVAASGQCLDVEGASQANGHRVVQMPCTGAYNQQWTQVTSGVGGWPFLVARHSGKGLTIGSESLLDRAPLVQYDPGPDGPDTLHAGDWLFQ